MSDQQPPSSAPTPQQQPLPPQQAGPYYTHMYDRPRGHYLHDKQKQNKRRDIGTRRKVGINISFRLSMVGAVDKVVRHYNGNRSDIVTRAVAEYLEKPEIRKILEEHSVKQPEQQQSNE